MIKDELLYSAELSHAVYLHGISYQNEKFMYQRRYDTLYIAFAGTDSFEDWIDNVYLIPKDIWHKGFHNAYQTLAIAVENVISSFSDKVTRIVFTGHSKGGAVANIFAHKYKTLAITFNAPKSVFRFVTKPRIEGIRIFVENDIVSDVPKFTYSHPRMESLELKYDGDIIDAHRIETILELLKGIEK